MRRNPPHMTSRLRRSALQGGAPGVFCGTLLSLSGCPSRGLLSSTPRCVSCRFGFVLPTASWLDAVRPDRTGWARLSASSSPGRQEAQHGLGAGTLDAWTPGQILLLLPPPPLSSDRRPSSDRRRGRDERALGASLPSPPEELPRRTYFVPCLAWRPAPRAPAT